MKRGLNRLYQWMWHVGSRRDEVALPYKGKGYMYRYPSPGSIYESHLPPDYRTPFQESEYNVRQAYQTDKQKKQEFLTTTLTSAKIDQIRKLELVGLLKKGERADAAKVEEAKKKFKETYKYSVEQNLKKEEIPFVNLEGANATQLRQSYKKILVDLQPSNQSNYQSQEEQNERPDIIEFNSLDFFETPQIMQSRVENAYSLEKIIDARINSGMPTREGSANYWKAIDNSHDKHSIQQVQNALGDKNPTDFSLNEAKFKFDFDKDGNVVNLHRIVQKK